jgi:HAD superfamily hydrolase (TIGR01509 family)
VTLLIFDCDGVLVDSEMIALDVLAKMLAELGAPVAASDCRLRFMGKSTSDVLAEVEDMLGRPIPPEMGERVKARLFERLRRELKPVQDVREAISALPYQACVASSSQPERIALSLEVSGLAPLFQGRVFSAAEVAHGKPAPDLFLHVAARLGVAPAEAIVIEDSPAGVIAARGAGMKVIGFAGASHADSTLAEMLAAAGAQMILTKMTDLPAAIERLRAMSIPATVAP